MDILELSENEQKRVIEELSQHVTESRWELMQKVISERTRRVTLVLEDIYQGHNAAAVVRSCDGFGVQDIHVIEKRNELDLKNTTVAKGADKWMSFHYHNDTGECIQGLQDSGYRVGALALGKESIRLEEVPLDKPVALMVGTEKTGLSEEACEKADFCIELPMYGFTQSYNLSVCAALGMNVLTSRMRKMGNDWGLSEAEKRVLMIEWLQKCVNHWEEILGRMKG